MVKTDVTLVVVTPVKKLPPGGRCGRPVPGTVLPKPDEVSLPAHGV